MKKINFLAVPLLLASGIAFSQTADSVSAVSQNPPSVDTTQAVNNFLELSLDDLMNTPIVSASKEKESSFDAPITSCVITRQEIINMGATSIPDALRFCPAIIVREAANGSYDVSIRGGIDGLPSYQYQNVNTTILAMIDNRPVFSSFQGGTFWQNLPVDLSDVERIEVVYGPNAPMYGPNAVSGVVNIITKKEYAGKTTKVNANLQRGVSNIYSAYIGQKISDKLEINVSANTSNRLRTFEDYYVASKDKYTSNINDVSTTPDQTYPIQDIGSKKIGANANVNYMPNKDVFINYNTTYNKNQAWGQIATGTALNVFSNTSNSNMLRAEFYNFTAQSSILKGNQGLIGDEKNYSHDYYIHDNYLDYNLKLIEKLSIRPAISYQYSSVNDKKYTTDVNQSGIFNSSASVENLSASLKFDYKPFDWMRFMAAGRVDKFSKPDKTYPSYQLALNIKPSANHIFRLAAGRSFNGSFIVPTFANFVAFNGQVGYDTSATLPNFTGGFDVYTYNTNYTLNFKGGPNRNLLQNDMFEIGYKGQLGKNIQLDVSIFNQVFQNISTFVFDKKNIEIVNRAPVVFPIDAVGNTQSVTLPKEVNVTQNRAVQNIDSKVTQNGMSLAVMFISNSKVISFKPHFTIQETKITDYQYYFYNIGANSVYPTYDLSTKSNVFSKGTPSWFGGFTLNLNPIKKLNLGISGYYFDQSYMTTNIGQPLSADGLIKSTINDNIREKGIFNAHVSYKIYDNISLGFNARNIGDNRSREVWGGDQIGAQYFATLVVEY